MECYSQILCQTNLISLSINKSVKMLENINKRKMCKHHHHHHHHQQQQQQQQHHHQHGKENKKFLFKQLLTSTLLISMGIILILSSFTNAIEDSQISSINNNRQGQSVVVSSPTSSSDSSPLVTSGQSTQPQSHTSSSELTQNSNIISNPPSSSSSSSTSSAAASVAAVAANSIARANQRIKQAAINKKSQASTIASQQNYDKYQLKATNSNAHNNPATSHHQSSTDNGSDKSKELSKSTDSAAEKVKAEEAANAADKEKQQSAAAASNAQRKASAAYNEKQQQGNRAKSSFSLLKKFLPSFMTSSSSSSSPSSNSGMSAAATAAAAAAAAVASASSNHQMSHSRSASSNPSSIISGGVSSELPLLSRASGKILNLLTSAAIGSSKKSAYGIDQASSSSSSIGNSNFLTNLVSKNKPSIDRQAAAGSIASLLSNPLSLGLLFSAPLIPSLLLTPLAIAGLSPAMSAINNFFGDDDESATSTQAPSPLSVLTGPSSPLSSLLQGNTQQAAASIQSALIGGGNSNLNQNSGNTERGSFALQAVQSILGPPATTEKPLFNPGMFASQGIQNAMGSLAANVASSSSSSSSSGSSNSSPLSQQAGNVNSPIRNFLGGNLIQTAASMISPTFAAPPSSLSSSSSSSSNADSDSDGPGLMEVASNVFDKVANYMSPPPGSTSSSSNDKDSILQASSASNASPLSTLVGLSNFSPFQLSSLLASSPFGSAIVGSSHQQASSSSPSPSASSGHGTHQRAGFFSTLKNVYELFSSSFLRRQEIGDTSNSNECQQRLICELHQRAMNSKLFRRSVQANLMELAQIDKDLQEQIKLNSNSNVNNNANNNPIQARVDADTKAMLNDFLKATNNFKNGRELVNCSKMFPKCSRLALLSTANAHLTTATNGLNNDSSNNNNSKAIGKFSNLMKKMKFKAIQQHQSQWKLRKSNKSNGIPQVPKVLLTPQQQQQQQQQQQYQPIDYLQVAPLSVPSGAGIKPQAGQLNPADSLKLVQQIMMMSQQQQQQQQQAQNQPQQQASMQQPVLYNNQQYNNLQQQSNYGQQSQQQPQQQMSSYQTSTYAQQQPQPQQPFASINNQNLVQASPAVAQSQMMPQITNTYTDAIVPSIYSSSSSTDSPYFSQSQQPLVGPSIDMSQAQNMQQQQQSYPQQQQQNYPQQQYPTSTSVMPEQQMSSTINNLNLSKNKQQQPIRAEAA